MGDEELKQQAYRALFAMLRSSGWISSRDSLALGWGRLKLTLWLSKGWANAGVTGATVPHTQSLQPG